MIIPVRLDKVGFRQDVVVNEKNYAALCRADSYIPGCCGAAFHLCK